MRYVSLLLLLAACTGRDDTSTAPAGTGRLTGIVTSPRGGDRFDILADALVRAGDQTVRSDDWGRYTLDDLPVGAPIRVTIEGPDEPEIFGTNTVTLTIPEETGTLSAELHVLSGCRFELDGRAGSEGPIGCGGATFRFPPGAVDADRVRARVVTLDPEETIDRIGFPQAADDTILGGVQVELYDPLTGAPLQVRAGATVTTRIPLSDPDGVAEDAELAWLDEDAGEWRPQPSGRVVREGGAVYLEFEAEHFSTYVAKISFAPGFAPTDDCIKIVPALCEDGCERRLQAELVNLYYPRTQRFDVDPQQSCIPVRSDYEYFLKTTYLENGTIFTGRRVIRKAPADRDRSCRTGCRDLGRWVLTRRDFGCATGRLFAWQSPNPEPYSGSLDVHMNGERIAVASVPPMCGGEACIPVLTSTLGETVQLLTPSGHETTFVADASSKGAACAPDASGCQAGSDCQDIGEIALACTESFGRCLQANFTYEIDPMTGSQAEQAACDGDEIGPHRLRLSSEASIGQASGFRWLITDVESGALLYDRYLNETTFVACVDDGTYQVELIANTTRNHTIIRKYSSVRKVIDLGGSSSDIRIRASNPTPAAGETVTLQVELDGDLGDYTYQWWTGFWEDPSPLWEVPGQVRRTGPSVEVQPTLAQQWYGVDVYRDGVLQGRGEIILMVDQSLYWHVELDANDFYPDPGREIRYRVLAYDNAGGSDVVSCIESDVTEIVWTLTWNDDGYVDEVRYTADPGAFLPCDTTVDGLGYRTTLPEGDFTIAVEVRRAGGQIGRADHHFVVRY